MKRLLLLAASLGGIVVATGGCAAMDQAHCWFLEGECLSYDQYLSIDQSASPKPTADDVLRKFGTPKAVHDRDGIRRRIDYYCFSLVGDLKTAEFTFDDEERLVKKELW